MTPQPRKCDCGSNEISTWSSDGYGIPLCRTCPVCHDKKMTRYRLDIQENYEATETIEEE